MSGGVGGSRVSGCSVRRVCVCAPAVKLHAGSGSRTAVVEQWEAADPEGDFGENAGNTSSGDVGWRRRVTGEVRMWWWRAWWS